MEVVVTNGAIIRAKVQSNHHHQQTNALFFYRPMYFLSHTNSVKALKGNKVMKDYFFKRYL